METLRALRERGLCDNVRKCPLWKQSNWGSFEQLNVCPGRRLNLCKCASMLVKSATTTFPAFSTIWGFLFLSSNTLYSIVWRDNRKKKYGQFSGYTKQLLSERKKSFETNNSIFHWCSRGLLKFLTGDSQYGLEPIILGLLICMFKTIAWEDPYSWSSLYFSNWICLLRIIVKHVFGIGRFPKAGIILPVKSTVWVLEALKRFLLSFKIISQNFLLLVSTALFFFLKCHLHQKDGCHSSQIILLYSSMAVC